MSIRVDERTIEVASDEKTWAAELVDSSKLWRLKSSTLIFEASYHGLSAAINEMIYLTF